MKNRGLRGICRRKTEEQTEGWGILNNEDLHIASVHQKLLQSQIKEDETEGTRSKHGGGGKKLHQKSIWKFLRK